AETISSSSSLAPCWERASTYALDIATVSLNIPPCAAVTTIMPALGGPSSTTFHALGQRAPFVVISRSWLRCHGASHPLPRRAGVDEHSSTILTNAAGPGPPCHRIELRCDTGMSGGNQAHRPARLAPAEGRERLTCVASWQPCPPTRAWPATTRRACCPSGPPRRSPRSSSCRS